MNNSRRTKIKDYIDFLDNNQEFETEYVSVGDGIALSKKKDNEVKE